MVRVERIERTVTSHSNPAEALMRLRSLALPVLALGLIVVPSAEGAPKKVCNLHPDPHGDVSHFLFPVNESKALDLVGGEVATGKNELVAVLKVATTDTTNDRWVKLQGPFKWNFSFTAGGSDYHFVVTRSGGGLAPGAKQSDTPSVEISGVQLDPSKKQFSYSVVGNTFVWRVPRKGVKALAKPNLVFAAFRSSTMANGASADTSLTTTTKYPDRAPSCVAAK